MKRLLCFAMLGALTTFVACKKDGDEYNPYPVWILNAEVVYFSEILLEEVAVNGCPRGTYYILPNGADSTVICQDDTNRVKLWGHIDSTVTIEYYIHCEGYFDSDPRTVTFRVQDAWQRPGRDGAEVIVDERIVLDPL